MSLFQIAEPGESRVKDACGGNQPIIGIDLGTTNSLVATLIEESPRCIVDEQGRALLPSVVHYHSGGAPLVGWEAVERAARAPQDTIVSVKRLMGKALIDVEQQRACFPYQFDRSEGKFIKLRVTGAAGSGTRTVTPVEVSAEILRSLRERAVGALGAEPAGAVITVPAYFDDAQRQATKDAGRLAGLNVLRLLNEPTAAALAYGLNERKQGRFAVYDLGGGTFDISILELRDGVFTVLSTAGDTALGGDDMDRALGDVLLRKHPRSQALVGQAEQDPILARQVLTLARNLKHQLSGATEAEGELEGAGISVNRQEFDAAVAPIVQRTAASCRRALKDAGLTPSSLDGVILVGGATRVPAVRAFVAQLFEREPLCELDPEQVVAQGAAIQGAILSAERSDMVLIDVTPLSLGLELMGGLVERIIPRNSRIPTGARQVFTTYADNQTGFDLHVVQGERETVSECRSLARFQLKGIPPMAAGMARLEVSFLIDENGILQVTARELTSGREATIDVKPSYGLTDQEVEQMLMDSYAHAEEDVRRRLLLEQRVEAERVLSALRGALRADAHLLDAEEQQRIQAAADALEAAQQGHDHRLIAARIEALDQTSKEFAQRRMNIGLNRAVAGRALRDIEVAVQAPEDG